MYQEILARNSSKVYDVDTRYQELVHELRDYGYRLTPQRLAVVQALIEDEEHPSAEIVYERISRRLPTTSLATVYNTLDALKAIGQVLEIRPGQGPIRYDVRRPSRHPHLICQRCGHVEDARVPEGSLRELGVEANGWQNLQARVDFQGICPACAGEHGDG